MPTRILDANDQERLGNRLVGMVDWNRVGPVDDTDDPVSAEGGDLVVVGDLADSMQIELPVAPETGAQVAVYIEGDPDGNSITLNADPKTINGEASLVLDTQFQFVVVVYGGSGQWGIASPLTTGPGVSSVFSASGDILPAASVTGDDLDLGVGDLAATGVTADTVLAETGFASPTTSTLAETIQTLAANQPDGNLAASQFEFWLDPTNAAGVLHIKAKTADGTVVGAAIPLA